MVLCYAAPIDSPPQNLRATVHQENGQIFFVAKWDKVDSSDVKGYKVSFILHLHIFIIMRGHLIVE